MQNSDVPAEVLTPTIMDMHAEVKAVDIAFNPATISRGEKDMHFKYA